MVYDDDAPPPEEDVKGPRRSILSFGEYKGNAMIVIGDIDDRYPFSFGAGKARKLMAAMDEKTPQGFYDFLKDFVNKNG